MRQRENLPNTHANLNHTSENPNQSVKSSSRNFPNTSNSKRNSKCKITLSLQSISERYNMRKRYSRATSAHLKKPKRYRRSQMLCTRRLLVGKSIALFSVMVCYMASGSKPLEDLELDRLIRVCTSRLCFLA